MYIWDIDNSDTYNNKMGRAKTKSESDFISKYLNSPKTILDIGGGSGRFAIPLKNSGHEVTVLDLSEPALKILKERNPKINCVHSDFMHYEPNLEKKFDIILAVEVLLYVKDWIAFFGKVQNLIKNDGIFIFTATNEKSWRTILQKIKDRKQPDYNYSIYSYEKYLQIIQSTNFAIDKVNGFLWIPCKINSNSKFVDFFSFVERSFRLNRFIHQSPWLIFAVKKNNISNA